MVIHGERSVYELGMPYKKSFLWWLPFKCTDDSGMRRDGALRYDIDRECFIDRVEDAQFRKRLLTWFKKAILDRSVRRDAIHAAGVKKRPENGEHASLKLRHVVAKSGARAKRKR